MFYKFKYIITNSAPHKTKKELQRKRGAICRESQLAARRIPRWFFQSLVVESIRLKHELQ